MGGASQGQAQVLFLCPYQHILSSLRIWACRVCAWQAFPEACCYSTQVAGESILSVAVKFRLDPLRLLLGNERRVGRLKEVRESSQVRQPKSRRAMVKMKALPLLQNHGVTSHWASSGVRVYHSMSAGWWEGGDGYSDGGVGWGAWGGRGGQQREGHGVREACVLWSLDVGTTLELTEPEDETNVKVGS